MRILYEDNHIIVAYKSSGEIVQGDKTGDLPLADMVKQYIKVKYNKPGEAFLGVVHRLDRPVAGLVVFARTSQALARLNEMFRKGEVHKTYWAITIQRPQADEGTIEGWITRNEKLNKSFHHNKEVTGSKRAVLNYHYIASSDRYHLLKVNLLTGRHHQIRCQLASIGCPIKGDLKYRIRSSGQ